MIFVKGKGKDRDESIRASIDDLNKVLSIDEHISAHIVATGFVIKEEGKVKIDMRTRANADREFMLALVAHLIVENRLDFDDVAKAVIDLFEADNSLNQPN